MGLLVPIALVWFIIEMLVWYLAAQFISGWLVFFWFIIAAIIGISLMRKGIGVLNPMAQSMKTGGMFNPGMRPQESTLVKTIGMAVAGILLLIPGLISDIVALLVMLPPVQKLIKDKANNYVMNNQQKMMEMMAKQMGGMGGMSGSNPFGNGQNPFGSSNTQNPFGQSSFGKNKAQNPFARKTTVDGEAKTVVKDAKKITSANDK